MTKQRGKETGDIRKRESTGAIRDGAKGEVVAKAMVEVGKQEECASNFRKQNFNVIT